MEEAFDPFGLEEAKSALEAQQAQAAASSAADASLNYSVLTSNFGFDDTDFDPFGISATASAVSPAAVSKVTPRDTGTSGNAANVSIDAGNDAGSDESPPLPPPVSRIARSSSSNAAALPPKLNVKLNIHEEVSSTAMDSEGASQVTVEGDVMAQVQCSDAMKNAPFTLSVAASQVHMRSADSGFSQQFEPNQSIVTIPKHEIGLVPVAHFSLTSSVEHMPLLLERKSMISGTNCRLAVQVRSKLTNQGNMQDFTIAVAVPEIVNGDSIRIVRGEGYYDELKRTIQWKLPHLERGNSFMVSAQLTFWKEQTADDAEVQFPVLLRCHSDADQISDAEFQVLPAEGHPSSVTYTTTRSFRLLHRLA